MKKIKVIIMGAAGRDFHNFNVYFKNNPLYDVKAFTATQIPNIADRKYPAELSGDLYSNGIPIYNEDDLTLFIRKYKIDEVFFSYSDISFNYVMTKGASVNAAGASFSMLGASQTMLKSKKPVIAVVAARTGSGKSQTSRKVAEILKLLKKKVAVVRHPMPYGDLSKQVVQRFSKISDLKKHLCTIEEMEEYEPHITRGNIVYAGIDYEKILRSAEKEAQVILWDGGNNDLPFFKPDLTITVLDPHRSGHELSYYPGMTNMLLADAIVINKIDSSSSEDVETVRKNVNRFNPKAKIIEAVSPISLEKTNSINIIQGKKALVIEDGPTLTHGEMKFGAGTLAAKKYGASEIIDPRKYAVKSIADTFKKYPDIGILLPAMGYGEKQIKDLETTINRTPCDSVIIATPIDLRRLIKINKPTVRVYYELQEIGNPILFNLIKDIF